MKKATYRLHAHKAVKRVKHMVVSSPVKAGAYIVIFAIIGVLLLSLTKASPSVVSVKSGNWSDPAVWSTGSLPKPEEIVTITAGHTLTYDVTATETVSDIYIKGTLRMSRTVNTTLLTNGNIFVKRGGFLDAGTASDSIPKDKRAQIIFRLSQAQADAYKGGFEFQSTDKGLWVDYGGRWEAHGAPITRTWSKLSSDAAPGATTLIVDNNVADWYEGGAVVVTPTSVGATYRVRTSDNRELDSPNPQDELRKITKSEVIDGNKTRITLDQPIKFTHSGTAPFKGEVALLTRNVLVKTEITGANEDDFIKDIRTRKFAHTRYEYGAKGDVQYTEFKYMGHYGKLSRYPLHPHVTKETSRGKIFRGNSGWISGFRFINLHITHGILIEDNVSYKSVGTDFNVEHTEGESQVFDSTVNEGEGTATGPDVVASDHHTEETANLDNIFVHNISVATQSKAFTDRNNSEVRGEYHRTASFWPGSATVHEAFLGNVVAGNAGPTESSGYHFPEGGNNPCHPRETARKAEFICNGATVPFTFIANESHSNYKHGLFAWQNSVPIRDIVDAKLWRNGSTGLRWGAYGNPMRVYNSQFLENSVYGVNVTSINTFLQDSQFSGTNVDGSLVNTGYNINAYVFPQRPEPVVRLIRNSFQNLSTSGISQIHSTCAQISSDKEPAPAGVNRELFPSNDTCSGFYMNIANNTFNSVVNPLHFGDTPNANAMWKVYGWTGGGPADFVLLRKDQKDLKVQGPIPAKLINAKTTYAPAFDALLTPLSTLPSSITYTGLEQFLERDVPDDREKVTTFDYTFTTKNDLPPTVTITVTVNNGKATVRATASDDTAVTKLELFSDWATIKTCTANTCEAVVDLSSHPRKYIYFYARAFDGVKHADSYEQRAYSNVVELGPETIRLAAPSGVPAPQPSLPAVPAPSPPAKSPDLNNDGKVSVQDLSILLSKFNSNDSAADLNNDGKVSVLDLSILLSRFGR